jgi:hypothetical protein
MKTSEERISWSYTSPNETDFYSTFISSAQRLRNGNTLICSGESGTIFEVTARKQVVWKYKNPVKSPDSRKADRTARTFTIR